MDRSSPGFGAGPRIGRSRLVGWHGPLTGKELRDVGAAPGTDLSQPQFVQMTPGEQRFEFSVPADQMYLSGANGPMG